MTTTLDGARLKNLTISGSALSSNLTTACVAASLSIAADKVTEMGLTFQDSFDLQLFRSKLFDKGATVRYGDWLLTTDGLTLDTGAAGPTVAINAPSKFVTALRQQTGAKSWGAVPLTSWVQWVANSAGMAHLVQPGLGVKTIARQAPQTGSEAENTWDVLTQQAREAGVWLFEYGSMLVFAKPSYLVRAVWPRRTWELTWNDYTDYSPAMTGMPKYSDQPSAELRESLTVSLVSADADQARPGDELVLKGRSVGKMGGVWIIKAVDFPLHRAAPVKVSCQRPIDPKVEPPQSAATSTTGAPGASGTPTAGVAGAFDRFAAKYRGVAIDADGAFGAQCVDLTKRYAKELFGVNISGNGNQWFANGAASGAFTQISKDATPMKGDIACWGAFYGGGYGHVAIVIANNGGSLRVLTQNPGAVHEDTLSKQGLQGYLRPKKAV
ncbi:minor tail protein [Arthrobacter phage Hirko]|nr:minor tail protein [Arthrobacter phage Hirko]